MENGIIKKSVLFIDRDGTIINEVPPTYQIDSFEKLSFYPAAIYWLAQIAKDLEYELVMIVIKMVWVRIHFLKILFGRYRTLSFRH